MIAVAVVGGRARGARVGGRVDRARCCAAGRPGAGDRSRGEPAVAITARTSRMPRADSVLFTVAGARRRAGTHPPRDARPTTVSVYRAAIRDGDSTPRRFIRVPSRWTRGTGRRPRSGVAIGDLRGIWMPTAGSSRRIAFGGDRAAGARRHFYYNPRLQAGVQTAGGGLRPGDTYRSPAVAARTPDLPDHGARLRRRRGRAARQLSAGSPSSTAARAASALAGSFGCCANAATSVTP